MRKRMLTALAAMGIIVAGVVWFAADESYVLNIQAHLEPALTVEGNGNWDLGTVFPQEKFSANITVRLSDSFKTESNVTGVAYDIDCQNKTVNPNANAVPLCEWLTVTGTISGTSTSIGILDCDKGQKECDAGPFNLSTAQNVTHLWIVHVDTPDCEDAHQKFPSNNDVDCDPDGDPTNGIQGVDMESEISIIRGAISGVAKVPCTKQDVNFPDCD